jgi:hypothetical protein
VTKAAMLSIVVPSTPSISERREPCRSFASGNLRERELYYDSRICVNSRASAL